MTKDDAAKNLEYLDAAIEQKERELENLNEQRRELVNYLGLNKK